MPKQMFTLNDFSGGLNTKASPRDIEFNELQKAENVIVSNKGLIDSSSDATSKSSATVLPHSKQGNGVFIFNSQYNPDLSGTSTQSVQIVCAPANNAYGNSTINLLSRDFGNTGNFTHLNGSVASTQADGSTANLLNDGDDINTTDTSVVVDDGSVFDVGNFITLDTEIMEITAISASSGTKTDTLTVARRARGSTAASHSNNVAIHHTDPAINMQVTGAIEPVYYYVDGVLYISDKLVVDGTNSTYPRAFQYVYKNRFGSTGNYAVAEWVDSHAAPGATVASPTTDDIFEAIEIEDTTSTSTASAPGEFIIAFDETPVQSNLSNIQVSSSNIRTCADVTASEDDTMRISDDYFFAEDSNTGSTADITGLISGDLAIGKLIYLDDEIMEVTGSVGASSASASFNYILKVSVKRGMYGTIPVEHTLNTEVKKSTDDPVGGGGWEEGIYEFTHTLVNQTGDETLPHTVESTVATIAFSKFFKDIDIRVNISQAFRKREKGFRVYTRIKDSNNRWILFLDADYERGVRTNLFDNYSSWSRGSSDEYADDSSGAYAEVTGLQAKQPSLETYESINGYAQEEESISLGEDGGFKCATVVGRRAWIANVRKNDEVFDDRIYYSPVNRFATFPDSFYLDIGISDGDAFTALHSLGNRLLAFKQKKLYVINVSSSSDAGWSLEAEYSGFGCLQQESVAKTPFGVCWVNDDGVFIFDGQSFPRELTLKLNDTTWRTNQTGKNPAIGYNNKQKQLCVVQDADADTEVFLFDFTTQSWSITKSIGSSGISNFVDSFDGLYCLEETGSSNEATLQLLDGDTGTNQIALQTKDIDFGKPGKVKKVYKVYITAKDDGGGSSGNTLTLKYALNGSDSFGNAVTDTATDGLGKFDTLVYTLDVDCESIAFELTDEASEAITINDITVEYREKYTRAS